jgi:hypothetical protein
MKKTEAMKLVKQLLIKRRKPAPQTLPAQVLKAGRVGSNQVPVPVNVSHLMFQENRAKDIQKRFNMFIATSLHGARLALQNERPSLAIEQLGLAIDNIEDLDTKAITRDLKLILIGLEQEVK